MKVEHEPGTRQIVLKDIPVPNNEDGRLPTEMTLVLSYLHTDKPPAIVLDSTVIPMIVRGLSTPTLYRVTGTLIHHTTDQLGLSCQITKQIPAFLLDGDFLGIVSEEHAEKIAREIVCPVDLEYEHVEVCLTAVKL